MPAYNFQIIGLKELINAIKRNPEFVENELKKFFVRATALYKQTIFQSPWRIKGFGGGAPVRFGNLKESHATIIKPWEASIGPGRNLKSPYSMFVHEGTRKMAARPWLNFAFNKRNAEVTILQKDLLKNIVSDLAS